MVPTNFLVKLVKMRVTIFSPVANDSPKMHQNAILKYWTLHFFFQFLVQSFLSSEFILHMTPANVLVKLVNISVSHSFSPVVNDSQKMHQQAILKHWTLNFFQCQLLPTF